MMDNLIINENPPSKALFDRVADIQHRFTNALVSIGIDPTNKDLLEVIADIADELNKTMCELNNLKVEFYNFKYKFDKENNK
jgi:hypothetical protein